MRLSAAKFVLQTDCESTNDVAGQIVASSETAKGNAFLSCWQSPNRRRTLLRCPGGSTRVLVAASISDLVRANTAHARVGTRVLRIFPMFLASHAKSLTISRNNGSTMRKKCCTALLVFVLACGAGCWAVVLVARMATCAPSRTIRGNCTQTFGAEFSFREQWRCLRLSLLTE